MPGNERSQSEPVPPRPRSQLGDLVLYLMGSPRHFFLGVRVVLGEQTLKGHVPAV